MVTEARKCGVKAVVVPYENRKEAESVSGIKVCPVQSLQDTIRFLEGRLDLDKLYANDENNADKECDNGSLSCAERR